MDIRLVSHASVLIKCPDLCIWTDPWLFGKAFNESWSLFPPAAFDESLLQEIDYIYISHEHPDHFHIPTLRNLPPDFKQRVTVLFQENNSEKMFAAFKRLGFRHMRALPHRKIERLSDATVVYCYQVFQMDSCLAVMTANKSILNANDAEINARDCELIRQDVGAIDVVLNQFSIAGYSGLTDYERRLPQMAMRILRNILANHRDLGAKVTIPFASFIYYCNVNNKYINAFANTPGDVFSFFKQHGSRAAILYPGDTYRIGAPYDSSSALRRYEALYATMDQVPYDPAVPSVPLSEIAKAFSKLVQHLYEKYPRAVLRLLRPVKVHVPDLETTLAFSVPDGKFRVLDSAEEPDLVINSQPLHFCFAYPYGVQTLGSSGWYTVVRRFRNWRRHRILFSLNNAEIYLRPKYLFMRKNLKFFRRRSSGALRQLVHRLELMQ
jgi:hypothetical protein